uniref:Uncharacterized protein n=1 Tax=Panagrolaimus sp. PS1159 TaxID=55785 RepID=A0AC35GMR8_9BILA
MPNNLYLATSRPRDYHFQPQPHRQESNTNMLRTARENPSVTNLRVARSEENIRTAILNEEGKIVGVVETHYHPSQAQQQQPQGQGQQQAVGGGSTLQGASSDYHFDALRGLNSAY